jgi:transcriptional repressor NrdR
MRCPFCGHIEDKVVDSRESREGDTIRRRRECLRCSRRFTSYERLEEVPILIVKKDGRREPFDRQKLLRGIMSACQKRPVSLGTLEEAVGDIQARLMELPDREVPSRNLGELVMDALKRIDSVAYVRFASVYRDFKDLPDFVRALESLMPAAPAPVIRPPSRPVPPAPLPAGPDPAPAEPAEPERLGPGRPSRPRPEAAPEPPAPVIQPFKSTPLFPGVDADRPAPPKRRKPH